jgi:hypothetical protein
MNLFLNYPDEELRASSGRKIPKISGAWKQYSGRKIFEFFLVTPDQFPVVSDRNQS